MTAVVPRLAAARGFSLVEVVVVLAILGVSAAVALPAFRDAAPAGGAVSVAEEVAQVLRSAHRQALQRAGPVGVTLDLRTGRYEVEGGGGGALRMATGVRLGSGTGAVRFLFERVGAVRAESLAVSDAEGTSLVTIERWSGDVGIRRGNR